MPREKAAKERQIAITPEGDTACRFYKDLRERVLVSGAEELGISPEAMTNVARLLRVLSGHYDQAARTAASL